MQGKRVLRVALFALTALLVQAAWALALTTGSISGKVSDQNGSPVAAAKVSVTSPSQVVTVTTSSSGFYSVLNLSSDTYAVTATKDGYLPSTTYGVNVVADQVSRVDITLRPVTKLLGRVVITSTASIVSRTVTGDLYAVNAQAIQNYQGGAGGAETLYSQNAVVGSLPGVSRAVGTGGGYSGGGSLSMRGGTSDQIGYEFDGVPLNRGFDFYNGTAFVTNGLSGIEVYTGGAPADAGRAMSGYVNAIPRRGTYPGGADMTAFIGTPTYDHTVQADVYGATPDAKFTYYVSTLAVNSAYEFGARGNLDNTVLTIPAGDPGCGAASSIGLVTFACGPANPGTGEEPLLSTTTTSLPVSIGSYFSNPSAAIRDTVANVHWGSSHKGLNDDLQALFVTGTTAQPTFYAGQGIDPDAAFSPNCVCPPFPANPLPILWPTGVFYHGAVGSPKNVAQDLPLTWPSSGGSLNGPIPSNYIDGGTTKYSIEKIGYTYAISQSSFLNLYGYHIYSDWLIDGATNSNINGSIYQLHDSNTGTTLNYQNQLDDQNLIKLTADWNRDLTLRDNYINWLAQTSGTPGEPGGFPFLFFSALCAVPPNGIATFGPFVNCSTPGAVVVRIRAPFDYFSNVTPENYDVVLADQWKAGDKLFFDIGGRYDIFGFQLMPMTINGPNGIAEQAQNQFGWCLFGYAYTSSEPCFGYLNLLASNNGRPDFLPGATSWPDASGTLQFHYISPRFGMTYTMTPQNVLRFSAGRYVQPPNSAFEEYRGSPQWGAGGTISILNRFYSPPFLSYHAVHGILPEDSTNYDLSYEHDFGSGISLKLTPYYRNTRNQVVGIPADPSNPTFVVGANLGSARIEGVEFLLRANVSGDNSLGGTLAATYTDAKLRFARGAGGVSYIDFINQEIAAYNAAHGTSFPMEDVNGYYSPSGAMFPGFFSPSYDVRWLVRARLDWRVRGFDITPALSYSSGSPYGEPLLFPDPTGAARFGPDPYTGQFDQIGSLKGPSSLAMNLGLAHDLGHSLKGSILWTNVFTSVHNRGYPWEYPPSKQVLSYADNFFYQFGPLGGRQGNIAPYSGVNYFGYAPASIQPYKSFIFTVSAKI